MVKKLSLLSTISPFIPVALTLQIAETGDAIVQLYNAGEFGKFVTIVFQVDSLSVLYSNLRLSEEFNVCHLICCVVPFPQISPPFGLNSFTSTSLNAYMLYPSPSPPLNLFGSAVGIPYEENVLLLWSV